MIIAHISDTHIQAQVASARSRLEELTCTVDSINALRPRPAAVLHTGDVAHDGAPADYAAARVALSRLVCPVYATVGNRDRRAPFQDAFASDQYLDLDSGFAQYAVDLGALRIIAVDTQDSESNLGAFCPEREANLQRLLDDSPGQPTLVFLHHAPVALPDVPEPHLQFRDPASAAALVDRLTRCSGLIGVFAGHVHCARSAALGDVRLSTVPSIATDLRKERLPNGQVGPVYHLHTIDGANVRSASIVVSCEASKI